MLTLCPGIHGDEHLGERSTRAEMYPLDSEYWATAVGQLDARFGVQCNMQPSLTGGRDPWCQSARCPSASPQLVFPAHEVRVAIGIIFYLV